MKIAKSDLVWWGIGIVILFVIIYVTVSSLTGNVVITGAASEGESNEENSNPNEKGSRYTEVTVNTKTGEVINS